MARRVSLGIQIAFAGPVGGHLHGVLGVCHRFYEGVDPKLAESIARPQLSKRERQVMKYLANGRGNKEIAQVLYISEHTAKAHVRAIMTKLNADSRAEVIAIAIKHGLIKAVPG